VIYLATASGPTVQATMADGRLAQMITYKSANLLVEGATFAIDNGVVRLDGGRAVTDPSWSERRWLASLDRYAGTPGCLFAVVPDVVGDAEATTRRWAQYTDEVRDRGYRPAYVLQDGCQTIPDDAPAVFIGGTIEWKLGPQASRLARQAKADGRWVHCGMVNTRRRLRLAADMGCDSVDGTGLGFGPDRNLPPLLGWLDPRQPSLFGGVA
jgi:hypothetical protein